MLMMLTWAGMSIYSAIVSDTESQAPLINGLNVTQQAMPTSEATSITLVAQTIRADSSSIISPSSHTTGLQERSNNPRINSYE